MEPLEALPDTSRLIEKIILKTNEVWIFIPPPPSILSFPRRSVEDTKWQLNIFLHYTSSPADRSSVGKLKFNPRSK